jgi:acyl-CoA synthetase (AMP-forming)/AMP-acid ligase II
MRQVRSCPVQHPAAHAATRPEATAVVMGGSGLHRTYRELENTSNRVAQLLRSAGLRAGDHVAVLLTNRLEWFDVVWGALRAGLYVTPVNFHLTAAEAGYIVRDCGARALFADADLAETVAAMGDDLGAVALRVAVGGPLEGFEDLDAAVADCPAVPIADEVEGSWMLYSSGTTGRPKGIKPPMRTSPIGADTPFGSLLLGLYGFSTETVYLSPAPLYHAAPAGWTTTTQRLGGTVVVMERFDAEAWLALVERHRVTHSQLVPTHLVRLLKLPEEVRRRYDLSSLRGVVHAAAPCPPEVKRAAIEWLGPIVFEYYSGSEGSGFCAIGPDEWLAHPGSVGRSLMGAVHIVGHGGEELPAGEEGEVWFESAIRFEYHGDAEKTAAAWNDRGWSTLGDIGRVDEEGYLYLTDRVAHTIISGGVNIYPREAEDVLVVHPAVLDVGVVGVPDDEMGERVVAYVQLAPDQAVATGEALADDLLAWCRGRLTHYKCPTEIRFVDELPRLPTGKLLKRALLR